MVWNVIHYLKISLFLSLLVQLTVAVLISLGVTLGSHQSRQRVEHRRQDRHWYDMIDCISTCIAALFQTTPDPPPEESGPCRSPIHRNNSRRSIFRSCEDSKQSDLDVDSSSNYLLMCEEEQQHIELQRREQIERYTSRELLYKQPKDLVQANITKEEIPLECVMW